MSGINTTMVVSTPDMIGTAYSLMARERAVRGSYQMRSFVLAACTITMIVSIAIPNERMREKFVRKFIEYPQRSRSIKVERNASGSVMVAKRESRKPTKSIMTTNTRTIVVIASFMRDW